MLAFLLSPVSVPRISAIMSDMPVPITTRLKLASECAIIPWVSVAENALYTSIGLGSALF